MQGDPDKLDWFRELGSAREGKDREGGRRKERGSERSGQHLVDAELLPRVAGVEPLDNLVAVQLQRQSESLLDSGLPKSFIIICCDLQA